MNGVTRAVSHALEAARLLRRRPSLLLVALAFGAWNGIDASELTYRAHHHTAWGALEARHLQESQRQLAAPRTARRQQSRAQAAASWAEQAMIALPNGVFLSLSGAVTLGWAVTLGRLGSEDRRPWQPFGHPWLSLLYAAVAFGVPYGLHSFTYAGYLGLLRLAVSSGDTHWARFVPEGRRLLWRLIGFEVVVMLWFEVLGLLFAITLARAPVLGQVLPLAFTIPIVFPLALTGVVMAWDNARLRAAMRTSRRLIRRQLTVAVPLIIGAGTLQWLAYRPYHMVLQRLHANVTGTALQPPALTAIITMAVYALLGAWFYTAAFLWYREAHGEVAKA